MVPAMRPGATMRIRQRRSLVGLPSSSTRWTNVRLPSGSMRPWPRLRIRCGLPIITLTEPSLSVRPSKKRSGSVTDWAAAGCIAARASAAGRRRRKAYIPADIAGNPRRAIRIDPQTDR